MTMPIPEDSGIDPSGSGGDDQDWGGNFNPKWESVLSQVPAEYHAKLAPELAKWDRGVQQKFQETAPWKDVMKAGLSPDMVQQAIVLAQSMQSDPRGVYDAMAQHYNFTPAQQKAAEGALEDAKDKLDDMNPWEQGYNELKTQVETLGKVILANHQREQEQAQIKQEDAELDRALKAAAKKFGPAWNEDTAMRLLQGFDTVEEMYAFHLNAGRPAQQGPPAPRVMGTGSTFPQFGNKNPADLNDSERTGLIAQMIEDIKRA